MLQCRKCCVSRPPDYNELVIMVKRNDNQNCLVLFDRVWSYLIKFEGHRTTFKNMFFVLVLMGYVLFVWTAVANMFGALLRTTLAQRRVFIISSVFYPTYFSRLSTHFNISMFGHQTMFHDVWSPNISHLERPLVWSSQLSSWAVHVPDKRQASYIRASRLLRARLLRFM